MEIILKADVHNLGEKDDLVKVKDGYALNFLIPQGLAVPATHSAKKMHQENLRQAAHKLEKIKLAAEQQAEKLRAITVRIEQLAGNDGKLYGSITPLQISQFLKDKGIEIDRRRITLPDNIKSLGEYKIQVSLHKEIKVELTLEVVAKP